MNIQQTIPAEPPIIGCGNISRIELPDSYCVRVTVDGLTPKGDVVRVVLTMTRNELAHLTRRIDR